MRSGPPGLAKQSLLQIELKRETGGFFDMESRRSLDRARQRTSRFSLGETHPGAMLRRTCGKIGMIAAAVLATWGAAAAEVLEVRSGAACLGLDGATGALLRFADPEAGLELAGGGQGRGAVVSGRPWNLYAHSARLRGFPPALWMSRRFTTHSATDWSIRKRSALFVPRCGPTG